jgi:hypothetical protein
VIIGKTRVEKQVIVQPFGNNHHQDAPSPCCTVTLENLPIASDGLKYASICSSCSGSLGVRVPVIHKCALTGLPRCTKESVEAKLSIVAYS